jgi:hypothetical protein
MKMIVTQFACLFVANDPDARPSRERPYPQHSAGNHPSANSDPSSGSADG